MTAIDRGTAHEIAMQIAIQHELSDEQRWRLEAALAEPTPSLPTEERAEQLAQQFHEAYERLAPSFGYKTREASAKPWAEVPENNRKLMTAVCAEIQQAARADRAELRTALTEAKEALEQHARKGHNDSCSFALCGIPYECDCGYDKGSAALAKIREVMP